jgi:hypothetical protein
MATKADFTPDEWKSISAAPFLAGLYISTADPSGLLGMAKEGMAAGRAISDSGASATSEIVKSIVESLKASGFSGRPELPDIPRRDPAAARAAIAEHLKKATATVTAKAPAEAEAFKTWLMAAARQTAEAAKEGGFLGIGGTVVSDQEQAALKELASTLGVQA